MTVRNLAPINPSMFTYLKSPTPCNQPPSSPALAWTPSLPSQGWHSMPGCLFLSTLPQYLTEPPCSPRRHTRVPALHSPTLWTKFSGRRRGWVSYLVFVELCQVVEDRIYLKFICLILSSQQVRWILTGCLLYLQTVFRMPFSSLKF